jgi:hypothetical protein
MVDVITVTTPGGVPSTVIPPTDVAVAIVGVAVSSPTLIAASSVSIFATTRGNELMGSASLVPPASAQVTPAYSVASGLPAIMTANILPEGANILLVNGDGVNPLWYAAAALTPPDVLTAYVYYIALDAREMSC